MSHTPGPWTTFAVSGGYLALAGPDGNSLGHFADGRRSVEECRANVVLCAAAPDLLAALQLTRDYLGWNGPANIPARQTIEDAVSAAIAKAEGKPL